MVTKPITVQMVGAGGILQLDATACPSGYDVMAVAHTPALIAYLPSTVWREVAAVTSAVRTICASTAA